jgi:hypothetical protein
LFQPYLYCCRAYFPIPQAHTRQAAEYTWNSAVLPPFTEITTMDMGIDIANLAGTIITIIAILLDFDTGHIIRVEIFTALRPAFITMARINGDQIGIIGTGMIGIEDNVKPD